MRKLPPADVYKCECGDHAWCEVNRGYVTLVSPTDAHLIEGDKWHAKVRRDAPIYCLRKRNDRHISLHREILTPEDGLCVDHVNGNGLDNRRPNIRPCTQLENSRNKKKRARNGYKGITLNRGKWQARVSDKNVGRFDSPEEAARAYDEAARRLHGQFARLNFPEAA